MTDKELNDVIEWLRNESNKKYFKEYVKVNYLIDYATINFDTNEAKKHLIRYIKNNPKHRKRKWKHFVYAALFVGVIVSISVLFKGKENFYKETEFTQTNISTGSYKAILTLNNGNEINLKEGETFMNDIVDSNGEGLFYSNAIGNDKYESEYNVLSVPRGGHFFVQLIDGTKIWLNSDSRIKYPVSFIRGESRTVELLYGEAYFDVTSSTEYGGASFSVLHESQKINVIGTEFNVKAYKEEKYAYTTLVEGTVDISTSNIKKTLKPNQQSIVSKLDRKDITVKPISVYNEISWKEGVFSFKNKSLKEIMKVLSRWYDVDIIFKDEKIAELKFTGTLNKNQKIEDILMTIKSAKYINEYEINSKTIIIK
ncbi:FecR family protein [Aquimarina rhabdastrellae]